MKLENDSRPSALGFIEGDIVDEKGVVIIPESVGLSEATMERILNCYNVCSGISDHDLAKVILVGEAMWEASEHAQKAAMVAGSKGFTRIGFLDRIIAWVRKGCAK